MGYGLVPVLYGNLLIYEVIYTHFQETYPHPFHKAILNLTSHWGCYNFVSIG